MKELSIEQKAKRYDEIIKKTNKMHNENCEACQMCIEGLIPELAESEDERIRKALINGFNKLDKNAVWYNGITNGQILAWLEKYGEQKPVIEMKTPEESLGIDSDTYNKIVDECIYGEQKPAEWTQDNVEELSDFENVMMHIGDSFFGPHAGLDPNDTNTIKEQATILLELVPKQEWSEEDYNEIETIACHLDNTDNECMANVLRNIRDKYYHIIPQATWKPSEEQIKVLEHFVRSVGESGYALPYDNNTKLLYSLLEQLKKLKG